MSATEAHMRGLGPSASQGALSIIIREAEFLNAMSEGRARNIEKLHKENEVLRMQLEQQAKTIARYQDINPVDCFLVIYDMLRGLPVTACYAPSSMIADAVSQVDQLQREAAFGRKMAKSAGVNII